MLVLSRKVGQRIFVGNNISILITDIMYGKVRIAIETSRDVEIWRKEIAPADHPLHPHNKHKGGNSANDGN